MRDSPVASNDTPPVKTAAVALPPLTPFFVDIIFVFILPFSEQCGQIIMGLDCPKSAGGSVVALSEANKITTEITIITIKTIAMNMVPKSLVTF